MTTPIQVGVVGFGLAGQIFHAAVLNETPGLAVGCIVTRTGAELAATKYPGARVAADVESMLADPAIKLCVIATPNDTHRAITEQCLRAGRHVVVDKPLSLSSADAASLAATAKEHDVVLSAFHNRRWDGDYRTLEALMREEKLGTPLLFESHYDRFRLQPRPGAWRETEAAGGGILYDLGPHLIDQALALFGPPTTLWADVRTNRPQANVDDTFDIQLTYEASEKVELRHLRAWLRSTMVAATPGARFTVHGTAGSYQKWGLDPQEDALKNGGRFADEGFGTEPQSAWGIFQAPDTKPSLIPTLPGDYRRYYENVRDAILGNTALAVGIGAAWSVARVIELARESSRTGQRLSVNLTEAFSL